MGKGRKNKAKAAQAGTGPAKDQPAKAPLTEDEQRQALVDKFGALVEESLIILFLGEHGYDTAYQMLEGVAQHVPREEASGSAAQDSSDASHRPAPGADGASVWTSPSELESGSGSGGGGSGSGGSQTTPLSGSALDDWRAVAGGLPDFPDLADVPDLADLPPGSSDDEAGGKAARLRGAFPTLKESDILRALRDARDDEFQATDILLNLVHLETTGQRAKGIDAFFQPDDAFGSAAAAAAAAARRKRRNKKKAAATDSTGSAAAPLALNYTLAPLPPDLDVASADDDRVQVQRTRSAPPLPPPSFDNEGAGAGAGGWAERDEEARQAREASSRAFAAASAAARRGRSDPLFRQAAVVYAERGHAQAQAARQAASRAADARVAEQSAADTVDVHFVLVHDGVRIAVERTQRWWARLGEHRARLARERPLKIITGIGLHSPRGYSRMYVEVGAALVRAGWKTQPGQGFYYVTGKK